MRKHASFKRYWILFAIVPFLMGGCGPSEKTSSDEIRLVAWLTYKGPEIAKFEELSGRFTESYKKKTGKTVKILPKQVPFDDLITNIKMACISKRTPDIARVDVQKVLELAYHKVIVKLDQLPNFEAKSIEEKSKEYISIPFQTNVVETRNREGVFERHLYGLPEQPSCLALFWNRKMFRECAAGLENAGLDPKRAPETWDELVAYGKVLTRKVGGEQYYGFGMKNSLWWTLPFFGAYNAQFVKLDENGKKVCLLGDELTCAAFQLKMDLFQTHQIEAGAWKSGAIGDDVGFVNEKYAMIFMGPWFVQKFQEKGIDLGVALIPGISKAEAQRVGIQAPSRSATNVGGNDMVIFETCQYKQEAYDFINFMTSCEVQLDWCRSLKQIPSNRKAAEILLADPQIDPIIKVFMEQIQYATLPLQLPRYAYIETDVVNPEMELALKGQKSVKEALLSAGEKITANVLSLVNE